MNRLDQLTADLHLLSDQDLKKVEKLVEGLKVKLPPKKVKNDAYLKVRAVLKDTKGDGLTSQVIIDERADRL